MIFNFGKYKGYTLEQVTDLNYLAWVFCNTGRQDVDYPAIADRILDLSYNMAHTFDKVEMLADREAFWQEFQNACREYNDSFNEHVWHEHLHYSGGMGLQD